MSQERINRFYEQATANPELMRSIMVVVPARPHDGLSIGLSQMLSAWFDMGIQWRAQEDSMGGFIDVTRMKIAYNFLHECDQKFLLMIDNDTDPPIDLPWLLSRHDKPVVGSCIASMSGAGRRMLCFTRADSSGITRFIDFEDGAKIPATGLAEVPHCGTGAMMIRRDVLESFTMELGEDGSLDVPFIVPDFVKVRGMKTGKLIEGEDIRFCKQARAKGFTIHVDMEAHCGHVKTMKLGFPPSLRDPSMRVEDWVASTMGTALTNG